MLGLAAGLDGPSIQEALLKTAMKGRGGERESLLRCCTIGTRARCILQSRPEELGFCLRN